MSPRSARIRVAAATALTCAVIAPTASAMATPAGAPAALKATSAGVTLDPTHGPVQTIRVSLRNTSGKPVSNLAVRLLGGKPVEADLKACAPKGTFGPGATLNCTVRRKISSIEANRGMVVPVGVEARASFKGGKIVRDVLVLGGLFDRSVLTPKPVGQRAEATVTSKGVQRDSTYGPVEKFEVWVKNTGSTPTKTLSLETPDGKVYIDDEGQQMFIGNCRYSAFPLDPGAQTTCDAYRRLENSEIKAGKTDPQQLVVAVFGKDGYKIRGLKTGSTTFDSQKIQQEARASVTSAGVQNDPTYGPVESMMVTVENTGEVNTKTLSLETPDGKVYIDDEGQQMFIGGCRPYAFPLEPGEKTTCEALRRLEDSEIKAGKTDPQQLVVAVFGKDGYKVRGLSTPATPFDSATLR